MPSENYGKFFSVSNMYSISFLELDFVQGKVCLWNKIDIFQIILDTIDTIAI